MSLLPKNDFPTYSLILPVSKQEIKFRPYVVKEQKLLLMAKEAGDRKTIIETISQIVSNCVLSNIDTTQLPLTDVEFIFYNLRARSESESIILRYRCENILENGDICGGTINKKFNLLTDIEVTEPLEQLVKINDSISIKMKHQKFEYSDFDEKENPTPEELLYEISKQIEFIAAGDSVFSPDDVSKEEIIDWLGDLTVDQYAKIEEFVLNEPKIHKNIEMTCKKCGTVHDVDVGDLYDFFM